MSDEPITIYTCAGCRRRCEGVPSYAPNGWDKVTVRRGAEHVSKVVCSDACYATVLRAIADLAVANDAAMPPSGAPYR